MTSPTAALTPETAARISRISAATVAVVGLASAAISYDGLWRLGREAGLPGLLAVLLPVVIDGLVIAGMLGVLASTLTRTSARYSWTLVLLGAAASVAGNVAAAPATAVGRSVAVVPPLALALALEQSLRLLRHRAGLPVPRTRRTPETASVAAPAAAAPAASVARAPRTPPAPRRGSTRDLVLPLHLADPTRTGADIAREIGRDKGDVNKILREYRRSQGASTEPPLTLLAAG